MLSPDVLYLLFAHCPRQEQFHMDGPMTNSSKLFKNTYYMRHSRCSSGSSFLGYDPIERSRLVESLLPRVANENRWITSFILATRLPLHGPFFHQLYARRPEETNRSLSVVKSLVCHCSPQLTSEVNEKCECAMCVCVSLSAECAEYVQEKRERERERGSHSAYFAYFFVEVSSVLLPSRHRFGRLPLANWTRF